MIWDKNLSDNHFMLASSTILVPVASLLALRKRWGVLERMVKDELREANNYGNQASSERLHAENKRYEKLQRCV